MKNLLSRPFYVLLIASAVVLLPAFLFGVPASRDFQQHMHMAFAYFDSLLTGNYLPGWLADSNFGYGDVSVRFYPPTFSFLVASFRALTGSWYTATLIVLFLLTFVSAFGAYWWARAFVAPKYAVVAGILYAVAPYHVNEIFQSSLLAEYTAAAALPFAFAFAERICARGGGRHDVAGLAASYAMLLLSNLPLSVIGSYALGLYVLLRASRTQWFRTYLSFAIAIGLGLLCSSFYWITVVAEMGWLRPDTANPFSTTHFLFSTLVRRQGDTNIFYGNFIALATMAMLLPCGILLSKRFRGCNKSVLLGVGVLCVFGMLMATPISLPMWEILPRLKDVQMPWRWLAVASVAAPVLVAASLPAWIETVRGPRRPLAFLAVGSVLATVAFTAFGPIRQAQYLPPARFASILETLPGLPTIGQWYPLWVADQVMNMPGELSVSGRPFQVKRWTSEHREIEIGPGPAADARIRTYYYPLWEAKFGGRKLDVQRTPDGALSVHLPPEAGALTLDFTEPRRSAIFVIVSLLGWLCVAGLSWRRRNEIDKSHESDEGSPECPSETLADEPVGVH